ncbi:MAG: hypothetical protein ACQESR_18410 [Planctomycetota bacterium]
MKRCSTQPVLPLLGLAADKVIRDRYPLQGEPWVNLRVSQMECFARRTA